MKTRIYFFTRDMAPDILLSAAILAAAMILLVGAWIPMEVTALLVLAAVAITGLIPPVEALAGFSSPAVVTIWAVFILSGGLSHTGVASVIGNLVLKIAGKKEAAMIAVIMATTGVLSGIMNNVAVAALMLPVVMDIAGHTGIAPSRLLMPLAFGALLGGMTTQIGTPPNILVTEALRENSLEPFSFFDFTPIGLILLITGIAFMVLIGRHLLPGPRLDPQPERRAGRRDWQSRYEIEKRLFHARIPEDSPLAGKSLATVRLGSILGWNVICINRDEQNIVPPEPGEVLRPGDLLTVEGRLESLEHLRNLLKMKIETSGYSLAAFEPDRFCICEVKLPAESAIAGKTIDEAAFFNNYHVKVLAVRVNGSVKRHYLRDVVLAGGERLLLAAKKEYLEEIEKSPDFEAFSLVEGRVLSETYRIPEKAATLTIPDNAWPAGKTIAESRVGEIFGSRVLGIIRNQEVIVLPGFLDTLQGGDRLLAAIEPEVVEIAEGIAGLEICENTSPLDLKSFISGETGLAEAILAPGATIEGIPLHRLNFREKYGLTVLAIRRREKVYRSNLKHMSLAFGDAIVLFGPATNLQMLGGEPDFVVLTRLAQAKPRTEKMKISISIIAAILFCVIMGWVPIYIAAITGAAFMVLTGCLTMEEAYRQIEWKAVFLIAGMMPLGAALDQSGAAMMAARGVVDIVGPYGPAATMAGLSFLTMLATCVLPIPATVVLMTPVLLNTAAAMEISAHSLMMAVSMAASASFITPVSHPAKLLVMGPGGYGFKSFLKVGIPMTLVILAVLTLAVPFFWPLKP